VEDVDNFDHLNHSPGIYASVVLLFETKRREGKLQSNSGTGGIITMLPEKRRLRLPLNGVYELEIHYPASSNASN
jgi:hypothetical protein